MAGLRLASSEGWSAIRYFVVTVAVACGLIAVAGMIPANASTISLLMDGDTITGATGFLVNGLPVDITFVDGSCDELYDGCTAFPYERFTAAHILDQFINANLITADNFTQISGCGSAEYCRAVTAWGSEGIFATFTSCFPSTDACMADPDPLAFPGIVIDTSPFASISRTFFDVSYAGTATTGSTNDVYAMLGPTPVPLPSPLVLFATAILALGAIKLPVGRRVSAERVSALPKCDLQGGVEPVPRGAGEMSGWLVRVA